MDCYEVFRKLEITFRNGGEIPLYDEEAEFPLEDRLSIQSVSGLTPFMQGIPEEIANEIEEDLE